MSSYGLVHVSRRFLGGLPTEGITEALRNSRRSAERQWTLLEAWLRRRPAR